ncbi:MAG: hypothetical protein ACJ786_29295 [Catenulispora sp.]
MTVVLVVLALLAIVAYEIRADRKVRRSTAGATPVVIVRGLKPRWWRKLAGKAVSGAVTLAILGGLLLAALRIPKSSHVIDYRHQTPPGATTPAAPVHSTAYPAAGIPTSSKSSTPKGH